MSLGSRSVREENVIYSFKVTAVNDGGESFPSEELSAMIAKNAFAKVLIIDGFQRVAGPQVIPDGFDPGIRPVSGSGVHLYALSRILRSANRIQHRTEPQERVGLQRNERRQDDSGKYIRP